MNILDYATQCKLALGGAAVRWQDTPVEETSASIATCPFRHAGLLPDGWWKRAEPRDEQGREIIRLTNGRTLRVSGDTDLDPEFRARRDRQHHANEKPEEVAGDDSLAPTTNESIQEWLARIAKTVDFNLDHLRVLLAGLKGYLSRFSGSAPAKQLDRRVVKAFLKNAV